LSSDFEQEALIINGIIFHFDLADLKAIAISVPDSLEIPERIVIHDSTGAIVGIDDPSVGHPRTQLHIPDSIEWISSGSFWRSCIESLTFGLGKVLRVLDGFHQSPIRRLIIPSYVEVISESAFEYCVLLATIDFSCCVRLRESDGFSGCVAICRVEIPVSVRTIDRKAFNKCIGLRELIFEERSQVREVAGFAGTGLILITFPRSLVALASGAFDFSPELWRIEFEDGAETVRIDGRGTRNCDQCVSRTASLNVLGSLNGRMAPSGRSWIIVTNASPRCATKSAYHRTVRVCQRNLDATTILGELNLS
jgi:hypothetical protein